MKYQEIQNNITKCIKEMKLVESNNIEIRKNVRDFTQVINNSRASEESEIKEGSVHELERLKLENIKYLEKSNADIDDDIISLKENYEAKLKKITPNKYKKYFKDEFNLVSRDMVKVYRDSNYTTILKVAGVTFDDYSYISKEMYNIGDKSMKFIEKIYIGFKPKDELNNLLTKYDYMNNIHEDGNYLVMESDLGGDIGTIDNIYYHLHTYLVIIACVVAIFALILLFNFINTTISYAKKNIGILKK